MPRNKRRLQLALYARPKHPGTYHYALFVAPKSGKGSITKHHVKNTLFVDDSGKAVSPWRYEETTVEDVALEQRILIRAVIAKVVKSCDDVHQILEGVPIYQVDDPENISEAQSFTCVTWVRDAWLALKRHGAVTSKLEGWEEVERKALEYLDMKREQKRWESSWKGSAGVPLVDLQDGKEVEE